MCNCKKKVSVKSVSENTKTTITSPNAPLIKTGTSEDYLIREINGVMIISKR